MSHSVSLSHAHEYPHTPDSRLVHIGEKLGRLRSAFLSAPIALCLIDRELRYVEVNERMARLNNRSIEAHIGRTVREVVPNIADLVEPVYRLVFETGRPVERRLVSELYDGVPRHFLVNYNPVMGDDGKTVLISVAASDVTTETTARDEADAAARKHHDVLESTSDNVILLSPDWHITYVNGHAAQLFSPRVLALGESLPQLIPGWIESGAGRQLSAIGDAPRTGSFEAYFDALNRWLEFDVFPTADGLSLFIRDVSDRRRAEEDERRARERIAFLATHDDLTGLTNRATFYDRLDGLLAGMETDGEVALLYLDLDGFKAVNDTMGHPAGDTVLIAVSERLRRCLDGSGLVCRLGGDEFVVAKRHRGDPLEIGVLAETIVADLSQRYDVDGEPVAVGVSIGIARAARGMTSDELVRQADMALYVAKAAGRGNCRFFEPGMGDEPLVRQLRKRALGQALHRGELALAFQPIVDLKTGKVASFEALLRWRHPVFSAVPLESVIAIAEETGMIHPIGEWVLREACEAAALWPEAVVVAVNVSVLQIRNRSFGETVKRVVSETGIDPARLTLEITETVLFGGDKQATDTLDDLRQQGVRISLDDFGKGYASLQYLKKFKVDKIKIDQSFVLDAHSNFASIAILRAVVMLARALGIATVAEGIELSSQYQLLLREGCDFGQGYFVGRPMPAEDCHRLLQRQLASA